MPKFTESQIKAAISARDKEARADSKLRKTMLARMQAMRRQGEKALTSYLKKTGFDFEGYDRILHNSRRRCTGS
jgi:predicted ATPase with chaperone activity